MGRYILFILGILFNALTLSAQPPRQSPGEICGAAPYLKHQLRTNPDDSLRFAQMEARLYQLSLTGGNTESGILTIPVVVHVIHQNGLGNIPASQVQDALSHLNDAFRNRGIFLPGTGSDIEIEFCLARQDTGGNSSTGINRVNSPLTSMIMETEDLALKNLSRWDPGEYLNIWVVTAITSAAFGPGVSGYASSPVNHGGLTDGIVIEQGYFGSSPNQSKILVHEAGHYLGLYHTFEGGCLNNNCLLDGDRICDTPPDASTATVTCTAAPNTCLSDEDDRSSQNPFRPAAWGGQGDQPDMTENYMDYGHLPCQNVFTNGQKHRMRSILQNSRGSLLASPGCQSLCPNPIQPVISASDTIVAPGDTTWLTGAGNGSLSYTWRLDGNLLGTGSIIDFSEITPGNYTIWLVTDNGNPACLDSVSIQILVECPISVQISASSTTLSPGDSVWFTATLGNGAQSGNWLVDGNLAATGTSWGTRFNQTGFYRVSFLATGPSCDKLSDEITVEVGVCSTNKGGNIWYFGLFAGLDFSGGNPVALSNGAMNTLEGNATISSESGDLMFYTNGVNVWNRDHQIMPNGTGLMGNNSSSQSALIIPAIDQDSLYYLFTVGEILSPTRFSYSLVDMRLDSGRGDVTIKNQLVLMNTLEKLTAVHHCNGRDYWVIVHDRAGNTYYSYLLTPAGLDTTAVRSQTGLSAPMTNNGAVGCLKASPDGRRLATATNQNTQPATYNFEVFDFDNQTGRVSNPVTLTLQGEYDAYGVEFSPDGNLLYATAFPHTTPGPDRLWQFDLNAGTVNDILSQAVNLTNTNTGLMTGIQAGPDGRIYVSKVDDHLGVIQSPNSVGTGANFVFNGVSLGNTTSRIGLPNFVSDLFFDATPEIQGVNQVCAHTRGVPFELAGGSCNIQQVNWELTGNGTITSASDSGVTVTFGGAGTDTLIVHASLSCGQTLSDTFPVLVRSDLAPAVNLGPDTALCGITQLTLNAGSGFDTYFWDDSTTLSTRTVTSSGTYWVRAASFNGCWNTDTLRVLQDTSVWVPNLGPDRDICNGGVSRLSPGGVFSRYRWQDHSANPTYTAWLPGLYWVETTDYCGNTFRDSILLSAVPGPAVQISGDSTLCEGTQQSLSVQAGGSLVLWQNGAGSPMITTGQGGWYWAEITDSAGCSGRDSLFVQELPSPNPDLGNDTLLCRGETLLLDAGNGNAYLWSTGDTTRQIQVGDSGWVWVEVTATNGCTARDSVLISTDICNGIGEPGSTIRIYPNPTRGEIFISASQLQSTRLHLRMLNPLGRVIYQTPIYLEKPSLPIQLRLPDVSAGVYLLEIVGENTLYHFPLKIIH